MLPMKQMLCLGLVTIALMAAKDAVGAAPATAPKAPQTQPAVHLGALVGVWVRSDGDYAIQVRKVDANGQVDAAYFNPDPIRVGIARATDKNGAIGLYVQLRDVGYPGSDYRLTYNAREDMLVGTYYQATLREQYDVVLTRLPAR